MRVEHAPAKLTLSLRVTGRRDDGYHLLDAEMVTVDLADTLLFGPGEGVELVPLVASPRFEPTLVTRALEAVGRQAFVRLEKRIPVGAGPAGASSRRQRIDLVRRGRLRRRPRRRRDPNGRQVGKPFAAPERLMRRTRGIAGNGAAEAGRVLRGGVR